MVFALALVELSSLLAVCCLLFLWGQATPLEWPYLASVLPQALVVSFCCLVCFYYNDLYNLRVVRGLAEFVPRLFQSLLVAFVLLAAFSIFFPEKTIGGELFAFLLVIIAALLLTFRAICYGVVNERFLSQRVLILGTSSLAWKITDEAHRAPHLRYNILGFVGEDDEHSSLQLGPVHQPQYPVIGTLDRVDNVIEEAKPDRVVVALSERRGRLPVAKLLATCVNGVLVEDGVEAYERITQKLAIESLNPSYLLFSKDFKKPRRQLSLRRATSLGIAAIGLLVSAPLMALIALLIKLDSKGPAFFIQERAGMNGRIFPLIKFRTMREGTTSSADSVWRRDDSRVTRLGKHLRRMRLDELPQFINILRGDMDLIGPRPEMATNVQSMIETIPYYSLRMVVRPGVTGWAQIKHGYSVSQKEVMEKIRYDLYYIKHMSIWLDLRILVDTVKIVLFGRGK